MPQIHRAFFSAYDKTGLDDAAQRLIERGIEIWASGGTARFLKKHNIPVEPIEELTGFSQLLGGRVKTLHPAVFSGILARNSKADFAQLDEHNFPKFDLVFVDLYPFANALEKNASDSELVELIDIGGVALLRAAAKNFARVVACHNLENLNAAIATMTDDNSIPAELSKKLAMEIFFFTSVYDSTIARYLWDGEEFPQNFSIGGSSEQMPSLRYGENPHQMAAIYATRPSEGVPSAKVLGGKVLSYNNFLDLDAAYWGAVEFDEPSCTIVKHLSPCGIATAGNPIDAYQKALASDSLSAFGGIVAFNRKVETPLAEVLKKHFFECILAPDYSDEALELLHKKKNLRLLKLSDIMPKSEYVARGISGGLLVQQVNPIGSLAAKWEVVSKRKPTDDEEMQLCFAMRAAKLVKSNTVLIAKDNSTVGIGGGLPSRVDAAILAVRKAGDRAKGAVAASDAFLPFPDTLYVLAEAGVTALVQPGGSRNDALSIEAADKMGIAMVFTGMRHFKH